MVSGGLLSGDREFYLLHEKIWDWGSGDIYDESGEVIGRMHRVLLALRADIELRDLDGSVVGKVRRKIISLRPTYDIFDGEMNLVGRVKKKILSVFRPALWCEDAEGEKVFKAQGNFMRWTFRIEDVEGNLVGEVKKADKWRDVFLGGVFDYSDKYAIRVYGDVFRLMLLGFVIAVDNIFHDKSLLGRKRGFFF
ncbi:MAG: LURP-one-related/scramblase family protein [Candidatus Odinarchaeia archaeon]